MSDSSDSNASDLNLPFQDPLPPRIFHYCSVSALLGIAESGSIWLTSSATTNDYMEQRHLVGSVNRALDRVRTSANGPAIDGLRSFVSRTQKDSFIASFSEERDLLSQWRAYAADGTGVAIGFDPNCFSASRAAPATSLNRAHQVFLHKVIYGDPSDEIEKGFRAQLGSLDVTNEKHIQEFISSTALQVDALSPLLKSEFFHEENEWRLVHYPMVLYKETDEFSMDIMGGIGAVNFREMKGRLVPYFFRSFQTSKATAIKEIVLGPKCGIVENTLWMLLCSLGFRDFEITRSKGSYR